MDLPHAILNSTRVILHIQLKWAQRVGGVMFVHVRPLGCFTCAVQAEHLHVWRIRQRPRQCIPEICCTFIRERRVITQQLRLRLGMRHVREFRDVVRILLLHRREYKIKRTVDSVIDTFLSRRTCGTYLQKVIQSLVIRGIIGRAEFVVAPHRRAAAREHGPYRSPRAKGFARFFELTSDNAPNGDIKQTSKQTFEFAEHRRIAHFARKQTRKRLGDAEHRPGDVHVRLDVLLYPSSTAAATTF
mmetsp:Transcript_2336/g.7747  ORF Transcript_2336/g.7747 Transcript_2336/m.7747 type:complete len:244 (+) Transcript_2336:402-1133(+)